MISALGALPTDAGELAHTLKGSARAIGAFEVASAADRLEAVLLHGAAPSEALSDLREALAQARQAIDAILRPS